MAVHLDVAVSGPLGGFGLPFQVLLKPLELALRVELNGLAALLPVGRAPLPMNLDVLEGLNQADSLVHGPTDGEIIDGDLAEGLVGVNDEESAEGDALVLNEDTIVLGYLVRAVGEEGKFEIGSKTTLGLWLSGPSKMGVFRVGRAG